MCEPCGLNRAKAKKIRKKDGERTKPTYFRTNANIQFSHGYCPKCGKRALEEAGLTGRAGLNGMEE